MTEPLSPDRLEQMLPALRHLAEMVAKSSGLSRKSLQVLLMGSGLDNDWAMDELERWVKILVAAKDAADTTEREMAQRALMLRGISEAAAMLAVSIAAGSEKEQTVPQAQRLTVSVASLDLGTLPPGQGAATEFEVQGGPGQVVVDSDQVRVTPPQFGAGPTRIRVEVKPLSSGVLWTSVKLLTAGETLEVPVVAQWEDLSRSLQPLQLYPTASPEPKPTSDIPVAQQARISTTLPDTCPRCGEINPPNAMNCKGCRINLAWARQAIAQGEPLPPFLPQSATSPMPKHKTSGTPISHQQVHLSTILPSTCLRCGETNPPNAVNCKRCRINLAWARQAIAQGEPLPPFRP